jgi:hypothetical protein
MTPVMFEVVYTNDWYDGPQRGVANYQGHPHFFDAQWPDSEDWEEEIFLLTPIDSDTLALALEDWAIWRRWETAFQQGETTRDTHPALPEDRERHDEIERALEGRLVSDPLRAIRKRGEFQVRDDPQWSGYGWRPLEVRWKAP